MKQEGGKSQKDLASCLSRGGMALTDNGFRSALRPNSATAKYSKTHIVFVEVQLVKYSNKLYKIQKTETQQWVQVRFEAK